MLNAVFVLKLLFIGIAVCGGLYFFVDFNKNEIDFFVCALCELIYRIQGKKQLLPIFFPCRHTTIADSNQTNVILFSIVIVVGSFVLCSLRRNKQFRMVRVNV